MSQRGWKILVGWILSLTIIAAIASGSSKPAAKKPDRDRAAALAACRSYLSRLGARDALDANAKVGSIKASVDKPTDYGLGTKQAVCDGEVRLRSGSARVTILYTIGMAGGHGSMSVDPSNVKREAFSGG